MIPQMRQIQSVVRRNCEMLCRTVGRRQVVADGKAERIKFDVAVGTKAKHVLRHVRPVMRCAEWSDVTALRIRPSGSHDLSLANLACVIVE